MYVNILGEPNGTKKIKERAPNGPKNVLARNRVESAPNEQHKRARRCSRSGDEAFEYHRNLTMTMFLLWWSVQDLNHRFSSIRICINCVG